MCRFCIASGTAFDTVSFSTVVHMPPPSQCTAPVGPIKAHIFAYSAKFNLLASCLSSGNPRLFKGWVCFPLEERADMYKQNEAKHTKH